MSSWPGSNHGTNYKYLPKLKTKNFVDLNLVLLWRKNRFTNAYVLNLWLLDRIVGVWCLMTMMVVCTRNTIKMSFFSASVRCVRYMSMKMDNKVCICAFNFMPSQKPHIWYQLKKFWQLSRDFLHMSWEVLRNAEKCSEKS